MKYRRNIFTGKGVISELKYRARRIAENYNIEIKNQETDKDHTHIIFSTKPTADLTKFINALKTGTSKAIRHRFDIEDELWENTFWSDSYCLITTGEVTLNQLKQYVENQGSERNEE
ncbi:MAG: REP element-mobilizing transposase RayT [Candidatus Methanohalarchaeum thermophilum]|uniref:REP element-mobilizing transposase RayT n=1 Tax=Methanohalarchaeum thermophilum TaxID=1903181 RepID=A0A1Q6DXQ0_METT1|nr:MAG: REP element-mobilizing transposase RayT [Candidatus Methanohalarchaeum thermophilum]